MIKSTRQESEEIVRAVFNCVLEKLRESRIKPIFIPIGKSILIVSI